MTIVDYSAALVSICHNTQRHTYETYFLTCNVLCPSKTATVNASQHNHSFP